MGWTEELRQLDREPGRRLCLEAWRRAHRLTQRDLAALAGIGPTTVAAIERGRLARWSTQRRLAHAFGVPPAVLEREPSDPAGRAESAAEALLDLAAAARAAPLADELVTTLAGQVDGNGAPWWRHEDLAEAVAAVGAWLERLGPALERLAAFQARPDRADGLLLADRHPRPGSPWHHA